MREKYNRVYEQLKNGELDQKLDELKNKVQEKTATKEEYEEMKKIERIKNNLEKINNVMEVKKVLEEEAKRIEGEVHRRDSDVDFRAKEQKLEQELEKLQHREKVLKERLKNPLTKTQEEKSREELQEISEKIEENNNNYAKLKQGMTKLEEAKKQANGKYAQMSMNELQARYNNVKNKSARCDLALANLLTGKSWDAIDKKLEGFQNREFSAREGVRRRLEEIKLAKRIEQETQEAIEQHEKENGTDSQNINSRESANNQEIPENDVYVQNEQNVEHRELIEQSSFSAKHPLLTKIGNWFKNVFKRNNEPEVIREQEDLVEQETLAQQEITDRRKEANKVKFSEMEIEKIINSKYNDFRDQLKTFSGKGMETVVEERIAAARERQKQLKEEAIKRQDEKFASEGKRYSEKSGDVR